MYGINLESENEKKIRTNTHQTQSIRGGIEFTARHAACDGDANARAA